jgi:opacity protein-like surface antigen
MFARHWSMKGEYLYYDLGTVSMSQTLTTSGLPGSANTSLQSEARYHGSIARLGVNYKF